MCTRCNWASNERSHSQFSLSLSLSLLLYIIDPYELCELMDPIYLRPDRTNQLLRVPEGIPLGATGKEDTLFVSGKT